MDDHHQAVWEPRPQRRSGQRAENRRDGKPSLPPPPEREKINLIGVFPSILDVLYRNIQWILADKRVCSMFTAGSGVLLCFFF